MKSANHTKCVDGIWELYSYVFVLDGGMKRKYGSE